MNGGGTPDASPTAIPWPAELIGQLVVADLDGGYVVIGHLAESSADALVFTNADLHDHSEANSTKDMYLIETRRFGIRTNRERVAIPRRRILAVSRLEDITL